MRRQTRGRQNNRRMALKFGVIFIPITIKVEWNDLTIKTVRMKQIKKFGIIKTKTQRRRDNCLAKRG